MVADAKSPEHLLRLSKQSSGTVCTYRSQNRRERFALPVTPYLLRPAARIFFLSSMLSLRHQTHHLPAVFIRSSAAPCRQRGQTADIPAEPYVRGISSPSALNTRLSISFGVQTVRTCAEGEVYVNHSPAPCSQSSHPVAHSASILVVKRNSVLFCTSSPELASQIYTAGR